jgi:hypothetical protein
MNGRHVKFTDGQWQVLQELKDAHERARQLDGEVTEWPISIAMLCGGGVSQADVRFLVKLGFGELVERIEPRGRRVWDRRGVDQPFSAASYLLPTRRGIELLQRSEKEESTHEPLPRWDEDDYTLYLGAVRVWHFARPAPHQVALVRGFDASAWANPLSLDELGKDRMHLSQLRNAVDNLNRNVRPHLRFRVERGGSRVYWEHFTPPRSHGTATEKIRRRRD